MKKGVLIVLLFVVVLFANFASADVISLNSGGGKGLVINPDEYLEGFFSGEPQILSSCGNGILETLMKNVMMEIMISGDGCSATCQNEDEEEEPPPDEDEEPLDSRSTIYKNRSR